ncbi:MAG: domain S-box protein [Ferruginibacter sp.]|nr:domain S-box protein [Ferruginibacter sp.]
MATLIRNHDWQQTGLGDPALWPQTLRTTLGIVLHSRFPMFLFWGPEHICFYNDAFRPSLGTDGKHPYALGKPAEEIWPEIWGDIKPMIDNIFSGGEATLIENQLLPIFRNGGMEDVYWTYSYSPVLDEEGLPAGIFVAVTETTREMKQQQTLQAAEKNLRNIIQQAPISMGLFRGPDYIVEITNALNLSHWQKSEEEVIGRPLFDILPELAGQGFEELLQKVYTTGETYTGYDTPVSLLNNGRMEMRFVRFVFEPYREMTGEITGIIVASVDVTEEVTARRLLEEQEHYFHELTDGVPAIIWITDETGYCNYLNRPWFELTGQTKEEALGYGWLSPIHPEDKEEAGRLFTSANEQQEPFFSVYRLKISDGEYRWVMDRGLPKFSSDGHYEGMIGTVVDIHEQITAEKEKSESERLFRQLIAEAPVPTALFWGDDFNVRLANQAMLDAWGKDWDVIGKPLMEAIPELEGQPFVDILKDIQRTGKSYSAEAAPAVLEVKGVKSTYYFNFTYKPIIDPNGVVNGIIDMAIDVTPQVLAKKALAESENNLRNMILQAPVAMCILHGEKHVVQIANERIYEVWGRTGEDFTGLPIFTALPEAAGQGLEEILFNVFHTGERFSANGLPINLPRANGVETVYLNFVYEAFRGPDKKITGIMAVANDVTEQVLARKELQRSAERLGLAIDAGELGMFEVNLATDAMITSPRFNEIFDLSDQHTRDEYAAALHPQDKHLREAAHQSSRETGVLDYTTRLLRRDGRVTWVRIKGILSFGENKQPHNLLGIVQDITEQKEMEFQKDSFLGIASHELKTPVTSIKAYAQVMEAQFKRGGDLKNAEMVSRIDKQVNRLTNLISDLLDVTKINSGKLLFNTSAFDLSQLVREVVEDMQRISDKHTIITELHFHGNVVADRDRLSQVITNMISNAVKYSPAADTVIVSTEKNDGQVRLCVQDFGIGISEDMQHRVFEQFFRVTGARQYTFPGLGLGLYISSEIISRMGGTITVDSKEGKGSTFCFSIPIG